MKYVHFLNDFTPQYHDCGAIDCYYIFISIPECTIFTTGREMILKEGFIVWVHIMGGTCTSDGLDSCY